MTNNRVKKEFPALTGNPVFYRTYSHKVGDRRETWEEVCNRAIAGLAELGKLTQEEIDLIHRMAVDYKAMPSGRWLWVGGRDWVKNPDNFSGAYNCTSTNIVDVKSFALMMSLAMMGSGTGAVLSETCISQLPPVSNKIAVKIVRQIGEVAPEDRKEKTSFERIEGDRFLLTVGDSREGWASSYHYLLLAAMSEAFAGLVNLEVDLGNVRPAGEKLKGFGGVSNPVKLPGLYERCAAILNKAVGRKLTSVECCLLIDEAAVVVVAGNVRRCLPKDTLVHTNKGLVPIEQIQEGTEVETPQGFRKVLKKFDQGCQQVYRVSTSGTSLYATEDHRIGVLVDMKGGFIWKKIKQLEIGDRLVRLVGNPSIVINVKPWEECETYDLEVEDQHCYFAEGYLHHNSAGIRQADYDDRAFAVAKDNLWQQNAEGNWRIDPERDALRMANHTRVFHHKPTLEEVTESVTKQYYSGEGAIQWAGEAIARSSADLLSTPALKAEFIKAYQDGWGGDFLRKMADGPMPIEEVEHRLQCFGLNPCGEVTGKDFHCNLAEVHLNQIDPLNLQDQAEAFKASSIMAAALLHHKFTVDRYQKSRELDPIIGVSFTGLFDFFVKAFGADWLRWWECDRRQDFWIQGDLDPVLGVIYCKLYDLAVSPLEYYASDGGYLVGRLFADLERRYLESWRNIVRDTVWEYCDHHNLKRPNRYTLAQPAGSKSLLTGASAGWHPPKGARYIRRITFAKNDPVALACLDAGYSVIPGQSDKDENGTLLNDPFDPRCTEWLVEIPVATPWADLEGCDRVDISKFSAVAQFDFYMQVQRYYTTHNTSATIELREGEVEALAHKIHYAIDKDLGYISSALLARFDDHQAFPRLPFEPISKEKYEQMVADVSARRKADFLDALEERDRLATIASAEEGPAACDSDKCLL